MGHSTRQTGLVSSENQYDNGKQINGCLGPGAKGQWKGTKEIFPVIKICILIWVLVMLLSKHMNSTRKMTPSYYI